MRKTGKTYGLRMSFTPVFGRVSPSALLAVLILMQLGCGPDDRATRENTSVNRMTPVERRVLVLDLQAGSVRDRSTRLTVPSRAVLDLAFQVRSKALEPGERSEPVTFRVRVDGEPIFEQ